MIGTADLLRELLDAAVAALTPDLDVPGDTRRGAPDRRYVSQGEPTSFFEDTLAVHTPGLRIATPYPGQIVRTVPMVVTLVREVPTPDDQGVLPDGRKLTAAAVGLAADLDALLDGLTQAWAAGSLWSGDCCADVRWGNATPRRTEGGFGGWTIAVEVDP